MGISKHVTELPGYPVVEYDPAVGIPLPVIPRREFRPADGKSDQFWAITLEGDRLTVQSGTIGTEGETETRKFPSPEDAQADYRKLVAEKVAARPGSPAPSAVVPLVRRELHLVKGESREVWEITMLVRSWMIVVRSGIIGPDGQSTIKQLDSLDEARKACDQLVAEQLAKGYTEKPPESASLLAAFYAALVANPEDRAARMALTDYLSEQGEQPHPVAYRVNGHGDTNQLEAFLADPFVGLVQALVIGHCWEAAGGEEPDGVVEALVRARDRFPHLRALFLGDIPSRECEISWITQSDLTGLLTAFPQLEHFRARGSNGLALRQLEHQRLESLAFEGSALPGEVVRALSVSSLPALEHLELWLGSRDWGDTTVEDLTDILQGKCLPALRTLGLRNSGISDDIAEVLAQSPLLERLRVLDLSDGTLGDRGAEALLASPGLARLEKLDIHHHYVSPALVQRLQALGIQVDASDAQEVEEDPDDPEAHRYVAHQE